MLNSLDPEVLANALAEMIDQNLARELNGILADVTDPKEVFQIVWKARHTATVTTLTHLIVMLPEDDRERIVKMFKLRAD